MEGVTETLWQYCFLLVNLLLALSPQDSDESDSESVQSQVMEAHQSPPAELEEDTAEETDATVVYNSSFRKPKQTHLVLLDVFIGQKSIAV